MNLDFSLKTKYKSHAEISYVKGSTSTPTITFKYNLLSPQKQNFIQMLESRYLNLTKKLPNQTFKYKNVMSINMWHFLNLQQKFDSGRYCIS